MLPVEGGVKKQKGSTDHFQNAAKSRKKGTSFDACYLYPSIFPAIMSRGSACAKEKKKKKKIELL